MKNILTLLLSMTSLVLFANPDKVVTYKTTPNGEDLKMYIFYPEKMSEATPTILFYHGGGWQGGNPQQFYPHCKYYADKGYITISASYRLCPKNKPENTLWNTIEDARSAMRYLKKNAKDLGVDANQIITAGSSAGAHLAISTALLKIDDANDDLSIDPTPHAVILMCPVVDARYKHVRKRIPDTFKKFSPIDNLSENMPPQIILVGDKDHILSVEAAKKYKSLVEAKGGICELVIFPDAKHAAFYKGKYFNDSKASINKFLEENKK